VPRDSIVDEVTAEVKVRIEGWKRELATLDAKIIAARRADLADMISGAEAELEALYVRKPALRPAAVPDQSVKAAKAK
jgi:hypothetical protein